MKVKICRHSERLDYANPLYWLICFGYHSADPPLTERGCTMVENKAQQLLSEGFTPQRIYSSPYLRTMTTASIMQKYWPGAEIHMETGLSEYQSWRKHRTTIFPAGIESTYAFPERHEDMRSRARETIDNLIKKSTGDLMIVTHGAIVRAYAEYVNEMIQGYNLLKEEAVPQLDTSNINYLGTLSFTIEDNKLSDISID